MATQDVLEQQAVKATMGYLARTADRDGQVAQVGGRTCRHLVTCLWGSQTHAPVYTCTQCHTDNRAHYAQLLNNNRSVW